MKDKVEIMDEISKDIEKNPRRFIEYLTILELEGFVKSTPGGRFMT